MKSMISTVTLAALALVTLASASVSSPDSLPAGFHVRHVTARDSSLSAQAGNSPSSPRLRKMRRASHGRAGLGRRQGHGQHRSGSTGGSSQTGGGSGSSDGASATTTVARTSTTATTTSSGSTASSSSSASTDSSIPSAIQGTVTGEATYYYQDNVAGSCGIISQDSDKVVAVKQGVMESSLCGKTVVITNTANSKSVTATIEDTCPGCSSDTSLDLSTGAFDEIGDESTGVLSISWYVSS